MIVAFAVGAALVSASLAIATFFFVRQDLVSQRVNSIVRAALVNARLVKVELGSPTAHVDDALSAVPLANEARSFVYRRGLWFSDSASVSGTSIPAAFVRTVLAGHVAEQRVVLSDGTPSVVVGVPVPADEIDYFELHPLTELRSTLGVLATVLTVVAVATTVGGGVAGWWASRRLVRPLVNVATVATEIAGGTLDRRLPDDPDLDPLVTSFNHMVSALQARIDRDARFTSDVTHELRAPLYTIGASVELLESFRGDLPDGGTTALDMLGFEVQRFTTMVEDLLELARMEAGSQDLYFSDVPVDQLVRTTVAAHDPSLPVIVAPHAAGTFIRADKRRVQRIIDNLLQNADVHGGGAVQVVVGREGPWVLIAVDDDGPGIAEAERGRVFERFYRGAASGRRRATGGTGLGLALVAEHVRAHHGSVEIHDRSTHGARVAVRLPVEHP